MRHDGHSSDTDVVTSTLSRRKRRESCRGFTCVTPWVIFLHWFDRNKPKGSRKWDKKKIDRSLVRKGESSMFKGSINCEASSSATANSESRKESSFNLGVGFGLVYLVAARTNEVNKLVELHHNLEMLLQSFKTEFHIKEKQPSFALSSESSCTSNTHLQESSYSNGHDSCQHLSSHDMKCQDAALGRNNRFRREKSLRMDQLEAELAAEFDRLALQMDPEMFARHSKQQFSEMNVESSATEDGQSTTFEDVSEPAELSYNEFYSVPPIELERRLHEVLEERQQERISELESALYCVMHHLEEKERELCWWKDTARVISPRLPDIPSLLMGRIIKRPILREETRILSLTYEKSLV